LTAIEHDFSALDFPVAFPRPGEGYGLGAPPFPDEQLGAWVVSAYADVDRVVRDHKTFCSANVLGPGRVEAFAPLAARVAEDPRAAAAMPFFHMTGIASDGDLHARERSFFAKLFTPGQIKAYEPTIRALCEDLTDAVLGRSGVQFVQEFAVPLPVRVIAHALGMPPEDFLDFKRWSDGFESLTGSDPTPEKLDAYLNTAVEFTAYISPLIEQRRREPAGDIISAVAGENDAGERLEIDEILAMLAALMLAGNETSTAAISGTMLYLVRKPELQAEVRADPTLIPALVEEGLRLTAPAQGNFRTATADTEVGGVAIAEGDHLFMRFAAGNRDDAQYPEPLCPRLDRPDRTSHLTFGRGVHFCVGAPLARAELRISFETLLARTGSITLSDREEAVVGVGNHMTARVGELYLDILA
jgi:cytochrome P450